MMDHFPKLAKFPGLYIYIYKNRKFIETANISLLSEALSMCNKITNENTDNSAT